MGYQLFLFFMISSIVIYGLLFWMWVEKWVSLQLILTVVTLKFIITVGWAYGVKVKKILDRNKKHPPTSPEEK